MNRSLGNFLRSRRERLTPEEVGLPRLRRRTPGLRREEVAALAGIGVDWYVRLEQGRATTPSPGTLQALARALRLDDIEAAHMNALARVGRPAPFKPERVPPSLARVVEGLRQPAYVTGRYWDVLDWNGAADRLLRFSRRREQDRNTLTLMLLDPETRRLFGSGWEGEARRMVALFRATHDLLGDDPMFQALLDRLRAAPEFDGWWRAHEVRASRSGVKVLFHPKMGKLRFEHTSFQVVDAPSLRLTLWTPLPRAPTASGAT